MTEKISEDIEKEADRMQDEIERIEKEDIQEQYKTKVPAFIWFLRISIILGIPYIILKSFSERQFIAYSFAIVLSLPLLYALFKRKKWGYYYGLGIYLAGIILGAISKQYLISLVVLVFLILLAMHKDYLNQ